MFEGVVANLLEKYLGTYVDNFSTKDLSVGVWGGDVKLNKLVLKGSSFDSFNLPISVMKGYVGKFSLKIPWKSLGSSSVVCNIEDVYLIVRPKKCCVWDANEESVKKTILKGNKLRTYEIIKEEKSKIAKKKAEGNDKGFVEKMSETVLNNLQITIKNVHIRYEDISDIKNPVVLGITLESLTLCSANKDFKQTFINEVEGGIVYKLVEMISFSVYMNNYEKSFKLFSTRLSHLKMKDFVKEMKFLITAKKNYILEPIKGELRVILQQSEKINLKVPKIVANLIFEEVAIDLDDLQYKNLLHLLDYFTNFEQLEEIRSLKPNKAFDKTSVVDWWKFAMRMTKNEVNKKYFRWQNIVQRQKDRKEYMELYKRKFGVPWLAPLEGKDEARFAEIENRFSYEDIIYCRGVARGAIDFELKTNKKYVDYKKRKDKNAASWFGWGNDGEEEAPSIIKLTPDQRKKLEKEIGYSKKKEIEEYCIPDDVCSPKKI